MTNPSFDAKQKPYEPDDPLEMIGTEIPGQTAEDLREMALAMAEEFVRSGWDEEKILLLFKNPYYQGPYLVWKQKGAAYVRQVIAEAMTMWRGPKGVSHESGL